MRVVRSSSVRFWFMAWLLLAVFEAQMASHPLLIHNYCCNILPQERNVNPGNKKMLLIQIKTHSRVIKILNASMRAGVEDKGITFFCLFFLYPVSSECPDLPQLAKKKTEMLQKRPLKLIFTEFPLVFAA